MTVAAHESFVAEIILVQSVGCILQKYKSFTFFLLARGTRYRLVENRGSISDLPEIIQRQQQ